MKTIVITGATAGIGLECAAQLAADGHRLCLVGRDERKLRVASERVSAAGAATVDTVRCDFSSLAAVSELADHIVQRYDRIDVLINNAGGMFPERTLTQDGYEATFAVNHLAGYLLTERLKGLLVGSGPARIVNTASSGHYQATMDFDDLQYENDYTALPAYFRSKLANVLYTRSLATELADTGVTVNALHPGLVATDIWSGTPRGMRQLIGSVKRLVMLTPAQGGRRITYLATDPALAEITGAYFHRNRVKEPSTLAQDNVVAQRLRAESDRLVGVHLRPRPGVA